MADSLIFVAWPYDSEVILSSRIGEYICSKFVTNCVGVKAYRRFTKDLQWTFFQAMSRRIQQLWSFNAQSVPHGREAR